MAEGGTDIAPQSSGDEEIVDTQPPATGGKGRKGKPAAAEPEASQGDPTRPMPVDEDTGLALDQWGLPISGPARLRWLADAGIEVDPALIASEEENDNG